MYVLREGFVRAPVLTMDATVESNVGKVFCPTDVMSASQR